VFINNVKYISLSNLKVIYTSVFIITYTIYRTFYRIQPPTAGNDSGASEGGFLRRHVVTPALASRGHGVAPALETLIYSQVWKPLASKPPSSLDITIYTQTWNPFVSQVPSHPRPLRPWGRYAAPAQSPAPRRISPESDTFPSVIS
jgi:hypothetical protein